MYMVAFMYPASPDRAFDYAHFVNVHLPMGVGLTEKYLHIRPEKIVVYTPIVDGEGKTTNVPYSAISSVFFATEADAKTFCTLFTYEEAARRLSEDFANYTPGAPDLIMAEVHELHDMDRWIRDFKDKE